MDDLKDAMMVNCAARVAILSDGEQLPITNFADSDGDDCEPADAIACVAGPDRDGKWWAIDLRHFDLQATQ